MHLRTTKDLQEAWPVLKSALEEYGISCALDLDEYFITFTTTKAKDSYAILDSRYLIRLLSAGVPPLRAVKVMNGLPCYLVYTGYIFNGLCKKFGIKPDKYESRKKLLMSLPVQELEKMTCCNIYLCPKDDMVAVMGPIRGMKLVRKIVEDCIVHNIPPAPRVRRLANYIQAIKGVEALRL
ncbi:PREDICTED: KRR1 small subunit processome component homolog [Prunus mume]|uniref:KRR-R motif-containing protein 1 n=1 Tax=Prunus mume TaxID=102107 RepID=A0ABM0N2G0_PRUMU|nr:PREDICTED: KRR1 small subunit processome component homolog [Prunus mume]